MAEAEVSSIRVVRKKLRQQIGRRLSAVLFAQQVRKQKTAAWLARKLEITEAMLSHYKTQKHLPGLEEFMRIMDILGVPPLDVLEGGSMDDVNRLQARAKGKHTRRSSQTTRRTRP